MKWFGTRSCRLSILAATVFSVSVGVAGSVTTNVWKNATGGNWSDAANWSGDPQTAPTTGFFDFRALANGETVTVDAAVDAQGVLFSGSADAVWTLAGTGKFSLLNYITSDFGPASEVCVQGGTLAFAASVSAMPSGALKTGNGTLRLVEGSKWPFSRNAISLLLGEGVLEVATKEGLRGTRIKCISSGAVLRLGCDALIGGLVTDGCYNPQLDLAGHRLMTGGAVAADTDVFGGPISGGGTFGADHMVSLAITKTPTVDKLEVGNGDLLLGLPDLAVLYEFENPAAVAADSSGHGRTLATSGSPTVVEDAERGKVLSLDGSSYLKGPLVDDGLEGLPCNGATMTVGFWFKADEDVNQRAGLFSWGIFDHYSCFGLALSQPSAGNEQSDSLFTIWDLNLKLKTGVYDGKWHHFAAKYENGNGSLFVDGVPMAGFAATVKAPNRNFAIGAVGKSWRTESFKGRIDDFFVSTSAYTDDMIYSIARRALRGHADFPAGAAVQANLNGTLHLAGDATASALEGEGQRGGVKLAPGSVFTVECAANTNVFKGTVSGEGSLVEKGAAGHQLVLEGASSYTGDTTVESGTLVLRRPVCRSGLMACYSFDDSKRPGFDSSDKAYHLSVYEGTASVVPDGISGGAVHFDGRSSIYPANGVMPKGMPFGNQPFSISLWIRPTAEACSGKGGILQIGGAEDSKCVILRLLSDTDILYANWGNNKHVTGFPSIADGAWHHVAVAYDGSQSYVYVDSVLYATVTPVGGKLNVTSTQLVVGKCWFNGCGNYSGDMDEIQFWNRAWSADEVADEYARRRRWTNDDPVAALPTPVAHWAFDDPQAPGKDSGPNGYDLVASGSVKVSAIPSAHGQALDLREKFGCLKANTFPGLIPTGNAPVTVSCRVCPDDDASVDGAMVFWGDPVTRGDGTTGVGMMHGLSFWDSADVPLHPRYTVATYRDADAKQAAIRPGAQHLRWMHVVTVYDPVYRGQVIYVDGVKCAVVADRTALKVPAMSFMIGSKSSKPNSWFKGLIDDVQIFDRALTEGEVTTLTRSFMTDGMPPVVSSGTEIDVKDGAKLVVDAAEQPVAGLSGSGTLAFAACGALRVTGASTFLGPLMGVGSIVPDGCTLTLDGDLSGFAGAVRVGVNGGKVVRSDSQPIAADADFVDGTALSVVDPVAQLPLVATTGALSVGATGTVTWNGVPPPGSYVLAAGASVTGPASLGGWKLVCAEPVPKHAFKFQNGKFILKVFGKGLIVLVS